MDASGIYQMVRNNRSKLDVVNVFVEVSLTEAHAKSRSKRPGSAIGYGGKASNILTRNGSPSFAVLKA
jgi:hypothetical protein